MQGLQGVEPFQRIAQARWARPVVGALGLLLAGTLLLSLARVVRRYNSPKSKRRRTVDLNKVLSLPPLGLSMLCFPSYATLCAWLAFRWRLSMSGLASCPLKADGGVQTPCLLGSLRDHRTLFWHVQTVVDVLDSYLPTNRMGLTPGTPQHSHPPRIASISAAHRQMRSL